MFRLQGHASVLALGGNNEVENSFPWFPATSQVNPSLYAVDFARLFLDTIRPIVHVTGLPPTSDTHAALLTATGPVWLLEAPDLDVGT